MLKRKKVRTPFVRTFDLCLWGFGVVGAGVPMLVLLGAVLASFPQRLVYPEIDPLVCVTFFTCDGNGVAGTVDLRHTYPAAVTYLEAQASITRSNMQPLRYELIWVDNGGTAEEHSALLSHGAQARVCIPMP
jgi:hypothetical protein